MPRPTPQDRTRPAAGRRRAATPNYVPPDGAALKAAHLALVGDYLTLLNYVTPRAGFAPTDMVPGFGIVLRPAPADPLQRNVYARENELFQILGRTKRVEAALDVWLTGALLVVVLFALTFASGFLPTAVAYLVVGAASVAGGPAGWWTVRAFFRRRASGLQ